jgi:hypothetical protein
MRRETATRSPACHPSCVSCAFCGRIDKPSREHVIPEWLSRKLSTDDDGWFEYRRGGKWIKTPLVEIVTKRVCNPCNNGWMSHIETQAQQVMEPLLDRQTTSLNQGDRAVVARWFAKTMLTAQLAETPRGGQGLLVDDAYMKFHRDRTAPMNQRTWLALHEGPEVPLTLQLSAPAPPGHGLRGYMSFGTVVIFAGWFFGEPGRMNVLVPPWFPLAVRLIWPPDEVASGPMPWPPPEAIRHDAVEWVREMITRL